MSYDEALILCHSIIVNGWGFPVSDHFDLFCFIVKSIKVSVSPFKIREIKRHLRTSFTANGRRQK